MSWIDISTPLASGMLVWPGDDPVTVQQTMFIEAGDPYNLTRLAMSAHTGTHIDAPRHFLPNGAGMEAMPLALMSGPALVINVDDPRAVRAHHIPSHLPPGARILFRTRNSTHHLTQPDFAEEFVFIERAAAEALAAAGAALVGIDYLSVGGFHEDPRETHEILLRAGIWIVEGLRLAHVPPGPCELLCLPILLPGSDGAPARALLRPSRDHAST